ncbi:MULTISPECIES: UBP-type zinc finger domain-containing protein [Cellulosimicrobium]|uniref:UBP-type zinc finger domain-containing protein n=1 Tax=Cellulosimicrobium TaxID=157920 RepID=UPI000A3272E3|nr:MULTISPECIES: UBP-type zinc finger domain-containing protein [unclassified Cellulosimicrobium]
MLAAALATAVRVEVPPSGTGCAECDEAGGWWVHLRRCATCGHVGCCDTSPAQHATAHYDETGHRLMRSFEPGEEWYWDFETEQVLEGPHLAAPLSRPPEQGSPGPADRVPPDWTSLIHR